MASANGPRHLFRSVLVPALALAFVMIAALRHAASLKSAKVDKYIFFRAESAVVSCEFVLGRVQNGSWASLRPRGFDDSQKDADLDDLKTALSKQFGLI